VLRPTGLVAGEGGRLDLLAALALSRLLSTPAAPRDSVIGRLSLPIGAWSRGATYGLLGAEAVDELLDLGRGSALLDIAAGQVRD
jgi:hypothetical protein